MKDPLRKRIWRELKDETGKYLAILILLVLTIGFVSGFLIADGSMLASYNENFEKYNIEDGNFKLASQLTKEQQDTIDGFGVTIYNNFYLEEEMLSNTSTLRIFANRSQVNLVCLMEGSLPENVGEIAIDRMYAENNDISVGDTILGADGGWTVVGLVALSDYSALFSDNTDMMFDAVQFGVAVVCEEEFEGFDISALTYSYSWKYDTSVEDTRQEKKLSEELMGNISTVVALKAFIPRYQNQAISYVGEDIGTDRGMMIALLCIVIVIMAFIFAVTISNTISKESGVIGTLRASGYTRWEIIRHYMTVPICVTLIGALVGNITGYTIWKDICAGIYYKSYSLTTYKTLINGEAFFLTTAIPVLLIVVIDLGVLAYMLRISPIKFLRHELGRGRARRALPLSRRIAFFSRFRIRIILQNMSNYIILLVGICFANLLLMFGMGLPATLDHYEETIAENMICAYQYFTYTVETENESAEKFSAWSLNYAQTESRNEEITLYGIEPGSSYVELDDEDKVYISAAFAEKYLISAGDTVVLSEIYEDKDYTITVDGIYEYEGAICVFMSRKTLNAMFDLDEEYFCGYFSDTLIADIDDAYISSIIDIDDLTKVTRQLNVSMGNMMIVIDGFAMLIFLVLIYLLSKLVIEKNSQAISMVKILGYTNGEIGGLYLLSTSIAVIFGLLITLPIDYRMLQEIFRIMMVETMAGWLPIYIDWTVFVKMFMLGIISYAAIALIEYRKIQSVPKDIALKNVE